MSAATATSASKSAANWNDIQHFMDRVVPWPGVETPGFVNLHYSMLASDGKLITGAGWPYIKIESLLERAAWCNNMPNFKGVWFCTSSQRSAGTNAKGKPKAIRLHQNVLAVKALWVDIDVKPDDTTGKHYTTPQDAWAAIRAFREKVGMPPISAAVNSGGGLHIYWISDKALEPTEWAPYAAGLKALLLREGVKCDAGLTTDDVRLLRMPGTFNHKYDPPREVKLLPVPLREHNFAETMAFLIEAAPSRASPITTSVIFNAQAFAGKEPDAAFAALDPMADRLGAGIDRYSDIKLDPRPIFAQCAFMGDALATGGKDYANPLWNLSVLCTTFMENGNEYAHAISKGHTGYEPAETQSLYERKLAERADRGVGYPQCATIAGNGCSACATCSHFTKGKSPLNLIAPVTAQQTPNTDKKAADGHDEWPDGFGKIGYANTRAALRKIGIKFTLDTFRQKEFSEGHEIAMLNGELSDRAVTMLRDQIRDDCKFYPSKEVLREAITAECLRNRTDPVVAYFNNLKWDGTPRLSKFLHNYLGADDTPLNEAIGRKLLCAVVRRSKQPGCKYDHEVVLQSGQGVRKSMFCEDLAVFPDLFTDAGDLSADSKQLMEVGQGKQIMEFPEHAGHSRAARDKNKANLTRRGERARPAYGHYAVDAPRQWVGIATVNPGGYLNDPTGERRYWHVAATKYDREGFLADKDQLYAEAVACEPDEKLWLDTPDLVKAHDAIVATVKEPNTLVDDLGDLTGDVWETNRNKIEGGWVIHREARVSNEGVRIKLGLLGSEVHRMRDIGTRISEAMMALGWTKVPGTLVCKRGAKPEGGYRRPLPDDYELVEEPAADASDGLNAAVIAFVKGATRG